MKSDLPAEIASAIAAGWRVFESETFVALGLGRAWFAFPPPDYVPPPRPAAPPLPNLLQIITEPTPRARGQRPRLRRERQGV
jgi:hypothetical protein